MNDIPAENLPCPCPRCEPKLHVDQCGDATCTGNCRLTEVRFEPVMLVRDEGCGFRNDPVALQECSVCAALVLPERRERHAEWHAST